MPWGDGISKQRCFSLTDLRDFDSCIFKFLIRHVLEKKEEIDDSSSNMALGTLLDESIKLFMSTRAHNKGVNYLSNLVRAAVNNMKYSVAQKGQRSFYYKQMEFINEDLILTAETIFKKYYLELDGNLHEPLEPVGFCEHILDGIDGKIKLWGGPDTYELGLDGVPEVCDYKYHENPEKGVSRLDMDLMPKLYILLSSQCLKKLGFSRARFVVRQWMRPKDDSLQEEFNLNNLESITNYILAKAEKILSSKEISFCEKHFCRACNSEKRDEYILLLQEKFATSSTSLLSPRHDLPF